MLLLCTELLFGWFTFAVYSLAEPAFSAARTDTPDEFLSLRATRAVIIMGLLGVATQCAALQGGQFMFTFLLLGYTKGSGKPQTPMLFRGRMIFFNILYIIKGVSEITIGSIVYKGYGDAELAKPIVSIPYVVTKPGLLIAGGTWVTLTGLIGLTIAILNLRQAGVHFSILSFFTFLVVIGLDDLGSVGIAPPAIVIGSLQVGLGFALSFLAAYSGAFLNGEEPIALEDGGMQKDINGKQNAETTV
ncbi:hypothetical protein WJX73_007894 [Symbiochloris irregularis]|uniref:Uncharacterized protein n=1 Tax=Symbiochloris irregularis TaxID=706552 RepID=A0AAW1NL50_9CHLO